MLFEPLEDRRLLAITPTDFGAEGEGLVPFADDGPGGHDHQVGILYSAPRRYEGNSGGFLTPPRSGDPLGIALSYLRQNAGRFGLTSSDIDSALVKSEYTSPQNGVTHIALRQTHNGLEVQAANILVNVMSDGRILDVSSTFVPNLQNSGPGGSQASLGAAGAYSQFAQEFGFELTSDPTVVDFEGGTSSKTLLSTGGLADQNVKAELVYVPIDNGGQPGVELAWNLNVQILEQEHWYSASMSAEGGGALYFEDWVSNAQYNAVGLTNESHVDGTGREILVDPASPRFSPFGWHDANGQAGPEFFDTRGNNVDAVEDRAGVVGLGNPPASLRPQGGPNLIFDFPLNAAAGPVAFTDAAITNLFVWNNISHDVFAAAGFTEEAGNFQIHNYTQRGLGGDPVLALGQVGDDNVAGAGNNAFMATPPDGQSPTMSMFTFDLDLSDFIQDDTGFGTLTPQYNPRRDGTMAVDVIVHEYGHGVTNRMTGGPANVGALNTLQSGGLGEGWSDYFGLHVLQRESDLPGDAYPVGTYLMGPNPLTDTGIRRFPYSFDMSINPLTFADYNGGGGAIPNDEIHNSGEIWAQALWDLQWLLVEKYGFDPDLYEGTGGNNLAFQLVMSGISLQVDNPSFLEARDAILRADFIENQGVNHKEIWEAFARRGMGFSADDDTTDGPLASLSNQVRAAYDMPPNPSFITGTVWDDANNNGVRDNEPGIADWEVFIDLNNDGQRSPQEPFTTTDANGEYSFELYAPAVLQVGETLQQDREQTFPPNNDTHTVDIDFGETVDGVDFGIREDSTASLGFKFHDIDGDGRRDEGEPGIGGIWLYVDYDDDHHLDLGEPAAITQEDGSYRLSIDRNGTFKVREVNVPGWVQTLPGGEDQAHTVSVTSGTLDLTLDFGNMKAVDYGDAPDSYGTTVAADGASHGMLAGLTIGNFFDVEPDGIPTDDATGDDVDDFPNDEDGVVFNDIFFPGSSSEITVQLNTGTNAPARFNAWFDFNGDGDFDDADEHAIVADRKSTGEYTYVINVPADAATGQTYARFRFGYESTLGPTGHATAGEVEDYVVQILNDRPDAIDDAVEVEQNSTANLLDLLANDISSFNGPIFISAVGTPDRGGRVTISAAGDFVTYSPLEDFFGNESFTYTISDQSGVMDTAKVSVTVLPPFDDPFAIDDSFQVTTNTSQNSLNVLVNDIAGNFPAIELVEVGSANLGFVQINRAGTPDPEDDFLEYTPNAGVSGTDQFTYTIQNQRPISEGGPVQATAQVTVHITPGSEADDVVQYRVQTTDLAGTPLNVIESGEQFLLQVYVQDLRDDDGDGTPVDRRGVAAAYLDVLYDFRLVSVAGAIEYGPEYTNAVSGSVGLPGILDEVGALQTSISDPLGADEVLLFQVPMSANSIGDAVFKGDPADITPNNDTLLFEPPSPVQIPEQRFVNSDTPAAPKLAHTLRIRGDAGLTAVDNTFHVDPGSSGNVLDVLTNDFSNSPPLTITSVGPRSDGGTVIITNGGTRLTYSPAFGFSGTEQFTYTVSNGENQTATATVSVQVGTNFRDVNYRIETTNSSGTVLTEIEEGSSFQLRIYGQDLRADDGNADGVDRRGIFAAYLDVLVDSDLVSTVFKPPTVQDPRNFLNTGGPEYDTNGLSGTSLVNIIDEYGAFQNGTQPLGPTEQLLGIITLEADAPGLAEFFVDPADLSPLHDTLLFEPTDPVDIDRINLGLTSINITAAAGGEGEFVFQNPRNPYDVDDNGEVTPRDVLLGVNRINARSAAGGEGEGGVTYYYDVNGDGYQTPNDILQVVNHINNNLLASSGGEGEGEGSYGDMESDELTAQFGGPALIVSQPQYADRSTPATAADSSPTVPTKPVQPAEQDRDALFANWDRDREAQEELDLDSLYHDYAADLAWSGGLKE